MSPQRRRSSRLRSGKATPGKSTSDASKSRLASLAERDETPNSGPQSSLDAVVSSPLVPRTPATAGRVTASREEMHPSKAQHSTTQEPDSGLRLGFKDIEATGNNLPSGITQRSPSKTGISSTFDFTFPRPGPQLGPEAQRMMDDLREEALRIKAKLAAAQEEEKRKAGETPGTASGRKFASAKGKSSRFSDVHMAEFKRMDSIAGHASAYRAQPGRLTPATASLKRTQSKAQLDDNDMQSKSGENMGSSNRSERLENTASGKRARRNIADDTSSARPTSRAGTKLPSTPTTARSQQASFSSLATPTQASLARAASNKKSGLSQIPTLARSPSKPNLNSTPQTTKHSVTGREVPKVGLRSILRTPGKFGRMKSMLKHSSSSRKESVPSSIPPLPNTLPKSNLNKTLSAAPGTPSRHDMHGTADRQRGMVGADTAHKNALANQNSPSPVKSGIPRFISKVHFGPRFPSTQASGSKSSSDAQRAETPSGFKDLPSDVVYPSLAGVRPLPELPRPTSVKSRPIAPPSAPGTFTFRSDHTISFGSSPGQASIRQVRPSILPGKMPGSFPESNKENTAPLPSFPHGMSNKKRRRVDSDDEEEEEAGRSPKKYKSTVAEGQMLMAPRLEAGKQESKASVQTPAKKKGVLSLSRLNMLARPKLRK